MADVFGTVVVRGVKRPLVEDYSDDDEDEEEYVHKGKGSSFSSRDKNHPSPQPIAGSWTGEVFVVKTLPF